MNDADDEDEDDDEDDDNDDDADAAAADDDDDDEWCWWIPMPSITAVVISVSALIATGLLCTRDTTFDVVGVGNRTWKNTTSGVVVWWRVLETFMDQATLRQFSPRDL